MITYGADGLVLSDRRPAPDSITLLAEKGAKALSARWHERPSCLQKGA